MAYYDPFNQGLKQPTGPTNTENPSKFGKFSRAATGEVQRSSGFKLAGTVGNIKDYPAALLRDSGIAKDAGLRANAVGAAKMGGRLFAAGNAGHALFGTAYDGATTSTEDYNKRFRDIPLLDQSRGDFIDKGSMVDKGLKAVGIGENERQFGRDLLTRAGGTLLDYGARAADSIPFVNANLSSGFADKQATTQPAAQPAAPPAAQPEAAPRPLTSADDEAIVGTGEHGFIAQQPKGLKSELYTNVPSQTDQFVASKGNVSTIQTGGAENYARQLANIQGLREGLGPAGGTVSVIPHPDKGDGSPQGILRKAIADLPRDMSPGNKADAVANLVSVMNGVKQAEGKSNDTGKASFGDMLRMKEFEHKLQREGVEDSRWAASNALQQQSTGATLASTGANVASTNAKMDADEFSQLFRKRDDDNKDVADTESISRFKGQLGQALNTLANTNDPKDRQRYAMQYQGVDGPKWRAKQWGELDDATKNHLTQMFRYSERMQALSEGGVGGGNFGMYNKPPRDAQGRLVVRDGDKIRAIVDANKLNSNDRSWFPFFSGVNESFGIERPKDYGSQFGAGR
jgi:hypothetical protein